MKLYNGYIYAYTVHKILHIIIKVAISAKYVKQKAQSIKKFN